MDYDTLARHGVDVVGVMGNNGIWALEKHPMEFLYGGWSVAADLRPETRYDTVVEALGGHGELVRSPGELRPALERAFAAGKPALVNVLTDPSIAYPRSSNLAALTRLTKEAARGGGGRLPSGPVRTGRGTCLEGPIEWSRRREAPMMRHRPDLCVGGRRREARPPFRQG